MTKAITQLSFESISVDNAVHSVGLDIAKSSFSLHGLDAQGRTVLKKELKRHQMLGFFKELEPARIGLEACASAHHWAREIAKLGHEVRLISPLRVKAFVVRQKNDAADAFAIARAMREPEMRFVSVKSVAQQSVLMLFKARDLLVAQRTMIINALRGHFAEIGIVVAVGAQQAKRLVDLVNKEDAEVPPFMCEALLPLTTSLGSLEQQIASLNRSIAQAHKSDERAQRLAEVPGIGVLVSTLLSATVSDPKAFASGREFAAWAGLVPRQHSTGGKPRLGHISKMGHKDLRRLLVVGAIAALARMKHAKNPTALGLWARKLLAKKPFRLVAVALANKMARTAWAIMAKGVAYQA